MTIIRFVPWLVVALLLAACGDDDPLSPDDLDPGRFTAEIRGDRSATFEGLSGFYDYPEPHPQGPDLDGVEIVLQDDGLMWLLNIDFVERGPIHLSPGTYRIEDTFDFSESSHERDSWVLAAVLDISDQDLDWEDIFLSVSGEITITESNAKRLVGGFEFTARTIDGTDGEISRGRDRITISGSFNACDRMIHCE